MQNKTKAKDARYGQCSETSDCNFLEILQIFNK